MKKNLMFLLTSGALALSAGAFAANATQLDQASVAPVAQAQPQQAKNKALQKKTAEEQADTSSSTGANSDGSANSNATGSDGSDNSNAADSDDSADTNASSDGSSASGDSSSSDDGSS